MELDRIIFLVDGRPVPQYYAAKQLAVGCSVPAVIVAGTGARWATDFKSNANGDIWVRFNEEEVITIDIGKVRKNINPQKLKEMKTREANKMILPLAKAFVESR